MSDDELKARPSSDTEPKWWKSKHWNFEDELRRLRDRVIQKMVDRINTLEKERDHWKANHDKQVKIKRRVQGLYEQARKHLRELKESK